MSKYGKINNSYESDTVSSNSASSSDSNVNSHPYTADGKELNKDSIVPPIRRERSMSQKVRKKLDRRPLPLQSASIESQMPQCRVNLVAYRPEPSSSMANEAVLESADNAKTLQVTPTKSAPVQTTAFAEREQPAPLHDPLKYEMSSVRTFGSEEISDQDVTCKMDMEKMSANFDCMKDNSDLMNISQYSIEPSSDPAEQKVEKSRSDDILTLSLCENSSNAVDNNIAAASDVVADPLLVSDLSFNGKIDGVNKNRQEYSGSVGHAIEVQTEPEMHTKNNFVGPIVNLEIFQANTSREEMNERSPDIFRDDDEEDVDESGNYSADNGGTSFVDESLLHSTAIHDERALPIDKVEKTIARNLQNLLSGVIPPPSVTILQHDINYLLTQYNANKHIMESYANQSVGSDHEYFTKESSFGSGTVASDEDVRGMDYKQAMTMKNYGLSYNRSQYTERIEMMYMKLAERNVGQETGSSYTYLYPVNSNKRAAAKSMLTQSPGNRLSHLARRRAVFSSANLLSNMQLGFTSKLGRKPCVIDASKLMKRDKARTPKRRTPGRRKLPGRLTPKNKLGSASKSTIVLPKPVTATRETSKRALFQSPAQDKPKVNFTPDVAVRVEKSKRALFSPPHRQGLTDAPSLLNRTISDVSGMKRRRDNDDENFIPRASKIAKSQSIAGGMVPHVHSNGALLKSISESSMNASQQLSDSHKKKLLWAVSIALQNKSIKSNHEHFKSYASTLAKVVKRLYLESLGDSDKHDSTSKTMLRLAEKLVFSVIQGKTVDEIYTAEKIRMENVKNVATKLTGYIAPEEYESRKIEFRRSISHGPSENSYQSNDSLFASHGKSLNFDENSTVSGSGNQANSSSKSNLGSNVLRENHDSKSAQKNAAFSGKDQKNVSPYSDKIRSATNSQQAKLLIGGGLNSNILKVKRQISFDA